MFAWIIPSLAALLLICVISSASCSAKESPDKTPPPAKKSGEAEKSPKSIGVASMESDGTIRMRLWASGPGVKGEGSFSYTKTNPEYKNILKHLGGLKPAEIKSVPPWPQEEAKKPAG